MKTNQLLGHSLLESLTECASPSFCLDEATQDNSPGTRITSSNTSSSSNYQTISPPIETVLSKVSGLRTRFGYNFQL